MKPYFNRHPKLKWTLVALAILVVLVLIFSFFGQGSGSNQITTLPG